MSRTPEVDQAVSNTRAGMYCTDDADTLAAEVERLESAQGDWVRGLKCTKCAGTGEREDARTCSACAGTGDVWMTWQARVEAAEADSARHKRNEELQMERAIKAEARVKELEREAADSAEEWAFCGLGVGSAAAAAMKHMEILKKYREQSARLRAALESLQSDAQCTIDLYNKIGPTWTSRDSGAEYYDASYVIGSAEERIATIKAALADTKGTT